MEKMEEIEGKIYKITSSNEKYYIGSTTKSLEIRLNEHEKAAKKYKQKYDEWNLKEDKGPEPKPKISSYYVIRFGDHKIELIEEFKGTNKGLKEKEDEYLMKNSRDIVNQKSAINWNKIIKK